MTNSRQATLTPNRTILRFAILAWSVGAAMASAQVRDADDLIYPPMPRAERPQPVRETLDNGLVILLLEDHELPLVEARALIRTGGRWEPADKIGLASLAGQALRSGGTEAMTSDQLDDLLEDRAAVVETSISTTSGSAYMSCLKGDFAEILGIFADVLRRPAFEESKLAVAKNQAASSIARQNDSADQIRQREFQKLIYGPDSPYARTATYATIGNIGRQDLVDWHGRYYHPDRIILGLVGDFDSETALRQIREVFGDWPRGPKVEEPEIPISAPEPGVFFVEKNDVNQSYIRIGHLGLRRDHPDFYAIEVMNQVLGGAFASRLFSRIRTQQGLAYSVFGTIQTRWDHPGTFVMSMSTKAETTGAGIASLLTEARNMTAEPPTAAEVEKARAALLNSFVFLADSTSEVLSRQLTYEYYGYPIDWLDRYRQGIEGVTTEQVQKAAAKHIQPDRFVTLVVGPREGTDRPLEDFGKVRTVDISIPEPEAPDVEVTEAGTTRAAELIAKAVKGLGGAERIDRLKNTDIRMELELQTPQGSMAAGATMLIVFPDRLRQETILPMGKMIRVIDGASGFEQMGPQARPMPEADRAESLRQLHRSAVGLLRLRRQDGFVAVHTGTEEIEGKQVELVNVQLDGDSITLGIDPATGWIHSLAYRGKILGQPGLVRQVLSDFREVDGLVMPFVAQASLNDDPKMKITIESVALDVEIDEALFVMPLAAGS